MESTQFNSWFKPTQIALRTVRNNTDKLKLEYNYGTTANNGNVLSQTITVPTVDTYTGFSAVQNYTYDSLNRLKSAEEEISSQTSWKQAFTFDRYGNRNFDEAETTTLPKNCGSSPNFTVCAADKKIVNPSINTTDNRLSTSDDYVFDSSGNTTRDAQSRKFTYDAENKQVKVETVDGNGNPITTIGEYHYDGDGKRIKKYVPNTSEVTIFVYDAAGKLVAEYSTIQPQNPKVSYTTADHLGSPRILTDENGATISRRDFHPFGEEIYTAERLVGLGYQSDDIRQKFTGYERDSETELDFAQARYFSSGFGRFSSPDDLLNDSELSDPQSWNKYAYVRNNPLNLIDPSGEKVKYLITIDSDKKTVTVTAIGTIGIWSKNYGKADLDKAAKRIEEGIESKWKGAWMDGEWKFDFNAQVSVEVFDKAKSTDEVLNENPNIMNVVQLEDLNVAGQLSEVYNQLSGGNASSKNWSLTEKRNPADGTKPDVAMWDYGNSAQVHADSEPAHEFSHLLGVLNQGTTGTDLMAPGSGQASQMSKNDFEKVVGADARYFRDSHQSYVNRNPNTKLRRFRYTIWRGHCCK